MEDTTKPVPTSVTREDLLELRAADALFRAAMAEARLAQREARLAEAELNAVKNRISRDYDLDERTVIEPDGTIRR